MAIYGILKDSAVDATTGNPPTSGLSNSDVLAAFAVPMSVTSKQPVSSSDTLSLKRVTSVPSAQRWEIETNIEPTNNSSALFVHSLLHGKTEKIKIRMPQIYLGRDYVSTSATLINDVAAGSSSITGNVSALLVGEFIKFSNHDKVYVVTNSASPSNSTQIFTILPKLTTRVEGSTKIHRGDNVTLTAYYDTDVVHGMKYIDGILMDMGNVKFVEAL
jgi:hypothetical protein